jgi:hypothetical protein
MECGVALFLASWRVRTWRFARLAAEWGEAVVPEQVGVDRFQGTASLQERAMAQQVRWAMAAWVRAWPFSPPTCLMQAVAARHLLTRRQLACELYFGVRGKSAGVSPRGHQIGAHAWLLCAGVPVAGEEESARFQPIAVYRWRPPGVADST